MKKFLLAVAGLGLIGGVACGPSLPGRSARSHTVQAAAQKPETCAEDEACWDWRTMGNHSHGICLEGRNVIEHADGRIEPGGRGCNAVPLDDRCDRAFSVVTSTALTLPVGWRFSCPEGRYMTNGETIFRDKLIKIGDSAGDSDDKMLQYVIAHELCHAKLWTSGHASHATTDIRVREAAADECAAKYGFPKP